MYDGEKNNMNNMNRRIDAERKGKEILIESAGERKKRRGQNGIRMI